MDGLGMSLPAGIRVLKFADLAEADRPMAAIDRIFFEASNVKSFESDEARAAFRDRWLGRFLDFDGQHAFVAVDPDGEAIGYVVGSLDDPATTPRFSDIGYFQVIAPLTGRYPAHLHMNLAPAWRSKGVGAHLLETFAAHARAAGKAGLHVVTGFGVRNVGFYLRNGLRETARFEWQSRPLVMLARSLH